MILDTIVEQKKKEVSALKSGILSLPAEFQGKEVDPPRGFKKALTDFPGVAIIAEAKKASPSKGVICPDFDPVAIARNYEEKGAQAISVLTDVSFFQGSLLYLLQVREAVNLPVLRKDFIIDQVQIEEARLYGADCILLIAAILDVEKLKRFHDYAKGLGMDVLTEVHDEAELDMALDASVELIGINNRNLKDFSMDLNTTFRLNKHIPKHIPVVSESGLKTQEDIARLQDAGISAALIGETLMRAGAGSGILQELRCD